MAEPTLLQQARQRIDMAKHTPAAEQDARVAQVGIAVEYILQHLEQRDAAASGPAQVPTASMTREALGLGPAVDCADCGNREEYASHFRREDYHHFRRGEPKPAAVTLHDLVLHPGESRDLPDGRHLHNRGQTALFINLRTNTVRMAPPPTVASDLDLDELQRLCDAAMCGPWVLDEDGDLRAGGRAPHGLYAVATLLAPATTEDSADSNDATARFIAAARDALPKLIARVRGLEGEVQQLTDALQLAELDDGAEDDDA